MVDHAELALRFEQMGSALCTAGHRVLVAAAREKIEAGDPTSALDLLRDAADRIPGSGISQCVEGLTAFINENGDLKALTSTTSWQNASARESQIAQNIARFTAAQDIEGLLNAVQAAKTADLQISKPVVSAPVVAPAEVVKIQLPTDLSEANFSADAKPSAPAQTELGFSDAPIPQAPQAAQNLAEQVMPPETVIEQSPAQNQSEPKYNIPESLALPEYDEKPAVDESPKLPELKVPEPLIKEEPKKDIYSTISLAPASPVYAAPLDPSKVHGARRVHGEEKSNVFLYVIIGAALLGAGIAAAFFLL